MTSTSLSPLQAGLNAMGRMCLKARLFLVLPPALSIASFLAIRYFDPRFLSNPVLLGLFGLFLVGQIVFGVQLWGLCGEARRTQDLLSLLLRAGERFDPRTLLDSMVGCKPSEARSLVLGWLSAGAGLSLESSLELGRNSAGRRSLGEHRRLGFHALVNRIVMKLGFLGTLVGLLLTFPPMKRAILGLSDSGGEMRFIHDIARAIDEDAYAIQATLVATGLSLLLEALSVSILEGFFREFELVDSYLADWHLSVLRPLVERPAEPAALELSQSRQMETLAKAQSALDHQLRDLVETIGSTHRLVEALGRSQRILAGRMEELLAWEADYRRFLEHKKIAAFPPETPSR